MNFGSDNVAGAAPEIVAALEAANRGAAMPYGNDAVTARLDKIFADLFEHPVAIFPVATGSAANALALAALTPPHGAIYCHAEAHIQNDECGAPEFYSGGAKLVPLGGKDGKLVPADLASALESAGIGIVHHVQPASVSISNETELGTLYRPDEVKALADVVHRYGLKLHMDGARFANAIAALGCSPAELSWRAGVDALSFGATKGGALAAEAVIFFDKTLAEGFAYRRKRGAHLFSKMRFVSAQLEAYVKDGLWLKLASHANATAARLAAGLARLPGVELLHPVEANEIFARIPERAIEGAFADGYYFYKRGDVNEAGARCRLVTAFDTRLEDVDGLLASLARHLGAGARRAG